MSSQLTHERCSELLADYLAGELDPEQHRLVEDHLELCAQCSAERAGLGALGTKSEGLTGDERVALRAAVLGSTMTEEPAERRLDDETDAIVVPLGGRGSRASKYLGIAAMLAILAVGSLFVLRGGGLGVTGSDDESDAGSAAGVAEDSEGGEGEALRNSGQESSPYSSNWRTGLSFQSDRGAISTDDLDRLGRRNSVSVRSGAQAADTAEPEPSEKLLAKQAPENQLERLAARAPDELAPDVSECGRTALDELDRSGLATYATTATLGGTDVVVLGFVTGDRTPDRYAVFAFPLGDCTTILTSTEGLLE